MLPQAYQTSQYVVPRGGIFLGKWRSSLDNNNNAIRTMMPTIMPRERKIYTYIKLE
jgi:hypothetical protein